MLIELDQDRGRDTAPERLRQHPRAVRAQVSSGFETIQSSVDGAAGEAEILGDQGDRAAGVAVEHREDPAVGRVEVGHFDHRCLLCGVAIDRIVQSELTLWSE